MAHRVAVVGQSDYSEPGLSSSVRRAMGLSGFCPESARGKRVLLKPNLLGAYPPDMGVTTPPAFLEAVARIFVEAGADVVVGDSPNWIHPIEQVWEVTGIRAAARAAGAREIRIEAGGSIESGGVFISKAVREADIVVNLPKFKTHGLTVLTLAVKNLFGCVCGMQKTLHHRDSKDRYEFADVLVRVAEAVKPNLTIIDGIVAMQGDGPSGGDLVEMGVILAGTDVYSLDAACCGLVSLPPLELDTLAVAKRMGLYDDSNEIEFAGEEPEAFVRNDFVLPATYTRGTRDWWITKLVLNRIWRAAWARPVIDPGRCRRCLYCVEGCPVEAIPRPPEGGVPSIDYKKCIQCFCCHELCPHKAIDLRKSLAVRLVDRFMRPKKRAVSRGEKWPGQ